MSDPAISKAVRWKTLLIVTAVALVAVLVGVAFAGPLRAGISGAGRLLGFGHEHDDQAVAVTDDSGQVQYYTCGMHPWVILPKPGDCPICHMELTPIDPAKFTGEITIDPVVVQNIGVRIEPVVTGPLTRTIRTVGTVDYNERGVRDVNIKVSGWIEKMHVDFVGAKVQAGDPLFELYSPQLYAAQEEYLLAWRNRDQTPDAASLLEAARTRLEYFDITDKQIAELQRSGEPSKTLTIRSPHTGVVIAKHANEGMKVDPGMQVYRIADLSTVWVLVTLYEYQLPYVEAGMKASMTLPYIPGQALEGEVIYIYPYLEKKTREVQVRLEFDNANNLLKPGMFANVQLSNTLAAEKTLAPRSAVIDTGERQVAFVSLGEGKFEPRDVRLGIETGEGLVEIISGLKPGEMVVTSGQFLIDSEAKIREALAKMIRGDLASEQEATAELAGTSALEQLPEPVETELNTALEHYFAIGDRLAADSADGLSNDASRLAESLDALVTLDIPEDPHFWHKHQDAVATARANALKLVDTADLDDARLWFAEVSTAMQTLLMDTGIPPSFGREVQALRCPMYRAGQGGTIWLQPAGDVRNPYFGSTMLECFDERKALPVTGMRPSDDSPRPKAVDDNPQPQAAAGRVDSGSQPVGKQLPQLLTDQLYADYLSIQSMLVHDDFRPAAPKLQRIDQIADYLVLMGQGEWKSVAELDLDSPQTLGAARDAFRKLSELIINIVKQRPPSAGLSEEGEPIDAVHVAKCPMAKGGVWLQIDDSVNNPYYGTQMPDCGSIEEDIETIEAPVEGYFYCGMHPWVIQSKPGDCPICGKPLNQLPRAQIVKALLQGNQDGQAPMPAEFAELNRMPEPLVQRLNLILKHYLAIGRKLASDSVEGIADHAKPLVEALAGLDGVRLPDDGDFWTRQEKAIALASENATALRQTVELAEARNDYALVSEGLKKLLTATGVPASFGTPVYALHCPMFRSGEGGSVWLQATDEPHNPYYGSKMLSCFDEKSILPVTADVADDGATKAQETVADDYPIDFCLVSGEKLGSMGAPVTLEYEGRTLKFCCAMCISSFRDDPDTYLKKLDEAAETLGRTDGGR
jgi:RND family efflux transporter MFP subunit